MKITIDGENMFYKRMYCVLFVLLLFVPTCLQSIGASLDRVLDVEMNNETRPEKPSFRLETFVEGSYQKQYEDWLQKSYGGRNVLVKTYNQLRFSLFQSANYVVGKNNNILQQIYIDEYFVLQEKYDFSREENYLRLLEYLDKLEYVTKRAEDDGKILIFVTTPNKCDFYARDLPDIYENQVAGGLRAIDCLREMIKDREIHYIDATALLQDTAEFPLFYNTGIHWSRPVDQKISLFILEEIERIKDWKTNKFEIMGLTESSIPYWRDDDMWNLLNIWEKPQCNYYIYDTKPIQEDHNIALNVLIQGGSFSLGFREDFYQNNVSENIDYIFYNQCVLEINNNQLGLANENDPDSCISDWNLIDTEKLIEDKNVFIIEMNEEHIYALNNGFVDFLYEYYKGKF